MTCARWRRMTHFSRQALLWHRITATHSQAGALPQRTTTYTPPVYAYRSVQIYSVWCQLESHMSLIPEQWIFFASFSSSGALSFTHHSALASLALTFKRATPLLLLLLPPRACTVTSASWCSSSRRPMETCSAGWHWARSWTAPRRSPPPRNPKRRRRPNSPDPGGTGQSVARNGLSDITSNQKLVEMLLKMSCSSPRAWAFKPFPY